MPSPLYQQFQPQQNNPMAMFAEFKRDPMSMLSRKFNIPQNLNNPNDILQHLLNSGQVSQEQVNAAIQRANMFR